MYSIVTTAIVYGLEGRCIRVEADVSNGLPVFEMVGFLSSEGKEAKERVRTALHNCGYTLPAKRITINLFPANVKKSGTGFDLPIAVAILAALGEIEKNAPDCNAVDQLGFCQVHIWQDTPLDPLLFCHCHDWQYTLYRLYLST